MTYDDIVRIGLTFEDVEEALSWGTPGLKRKGKFMLRLKEDGETIAVKLDWDTHDRLLEEAPEVFFKTPHYEGYPALLARLDAIGPSLASELLQASWRSAFSPQRPPRVRGTRGSSPPT